MSLLLNTSLVVTPTVYNAGTLFGIVPTDPSSNNADFSVTRATTKTRTNSAGLIETIAINVPSIDYSLGGCPNILLEPQRTNLFVRSNEFNTSWSSILGSVTANATISPSGSMDADRFTADGSTGSHRIAQAVLITSGSAYTISCYVKKDTNDFFQFYLTSANFGAQAFANFDVNNGVLGTLGANSIASSITDAGNGWYRCSMTSNAISSSAAVSLNSSLITTATSSRGSSNDLTTSLFLWGAQVEQGAYPTSYIPTTSATVTRNADVISKTGISSLIGQTQGTIFAEIKVSKLLGAVSRYIFHVSDGTADNRIYVAFGNAASNQIRGRIFFGGVLQCSINSSTITSTGTYKLALAYNNNDVVLYINGVQVGVDTSATIPACSRVDVGENYAGASQFSDGIAASAIWQTRLTNTQLAQLTTL